MHNSSQKTLDSLYQCIGEKRYKIAGWGNKIIGYGLKPSEFDNFEDSSRSMFYKNKNELLSQKYIESARTDKTKSTNHKPRYSITLLGILKLFQTKSIGSEGFKNIMQILSTHYPNDYDSNYSPSWESYDEIEDYSFVLRWYLLANKKQPKQIDKAILKMFESIKPTILFEVLSKIINGVDTQLIDNSTECTFSINISRYNRITFWKFIFKNNQITCVLGPGPLEYIGWEDEYDLTLEEFNSELAEFILEGMWYILLKYYKEKLPKNLVHDLTDYVIDTVNEQVEHIGMYM